MCDVLTEDVVYDAADLPQGSYPLNQIVFVGISVQQFRDISLLTQLTNLKIATFRLCGFFKFPEEFFELPGLMNIDISGNSLNNLPNADRFATLQNLRFLNISDNSINDIREIFKLRSSPKLLDLTLVGNVCMSSNDAFNRIVKEIPTLLALNESIITSQHRGYLDGSAGFDNQSLIPRTATDDYFFLYLKYINGADITQRYLRRSNAEFFCIDRVVRRTSAVIKIQSVYRGYLARSFFKLQKKSAIFLQCIIKWWYYKRDKSANKIQIAYLHYKLKKQIKEIVNARKIQSAFRMFLSRQETLSNVFEYEGKYVFYVSSTVIGALKLYLNQHNIPSPDSEMISDYVVIRYGNITKRNLVGSPVVYYNVEENVLVRKLTQNKSSKLSVWCGHDHTQPSQVIQVNEEGINWSRKCPFQSLKFKPYRNPIKKCKTIKYPHLIRFEYSSHGIFKSFITELVRNAPPGIVVFSERVLMGASAQLTMHSAFRTFLVRMKFDEVRKQVIDRRAAFMIKTFLHTNRITRFLKHTFITNNYFYSLPEEPVFFTSLDTLDKINLLKTPFPLKFGYTQERLVILSPTEDTYMNSIVQRGKPQYEVKDLLPSLLRVGVTIAKPLPSMFTECPPTKWIRRDKIVRLIFSSPEEARIRTTLFGYITGNFNLIYTEKDLHARLAANTIRNAWVGHSLRSIMIHVAAQAGKIIHPASILVKEKPPPKKEYVAPKTEFFQKLVDVEVKPNDVIAAIRNDYRPWRQAVIDWKNMKKIEAIYAGKPPPPPPPDEPTQSQRELGLVNDLGNAFSQTNPQSERAVPPWEKTPFITQRPRPKPKKPPKIDLELETETIFAPPLAKLRPITVQLSPDYSYNTSVDFKPYPVKEEFISIDAAETIVRPSPDPIEPIKPVTINISSKEHKRKKSPLRESPNAGRADTPYDYKPLKDTDMFKPKKASTSRGEVFKQSEHPTVKVSKKKKAPQMPEPFSPKPSKKKDAQTNLPPTLLASGNQATQQVEAEDQIHVTIPSEFKKKSSTIVKPGHISKVQSSPRVAKLKPPSLSSTEPGRIAYIASMNDAPKIEKPVRQHLAELSEVPIQVDEVQNPISEVRIHMSDTPQNVTFSSEKERTVVQRLPLNPPSLRPSTTTKLTREASMLSAKRPNTPASTNKYLTEPKPTSLFVEREPRERTVPDPQQTDNTFQMKQRAAFTKLVRMHQIALQIRQEAIIDNTMEENFARTRSIRDNQADSRLQNEIEKESFITEVRDRNMIEKIDLFEQLNEIKYHTKTQRTRRAKTVREEHRAHVNRYKKEKQFAQHFVSVSRKVAQMSEKTHRKAEERKKFEQLQSEMGEARKELEMSKQRYKEKASEIEKSKLKRAQVDKQLTEAKRQVQIEAAQNRLNRLQEVKQREKDTKEAVRIVRSKPLYIYPDTAPSLDLDEVEGAAKILGQFMGINGLAAMESHFLAEIIADIV